MNLISEVHSERLSFLRNYIACLEQGHKFSSDQFFIRESAELELYGFEPNDSIAQYRMTEVQLFAIEVEETFRAQMVVVIWGFLERLVSDAISSIVAFKKASKKFVKKRNESLVDSWRSFLENDIHSGVELSPSEWEMLNDILAVRNFIAHSSHRPGNQPRNKQKHAVGRIPGMRLAPDGISISKECIESLLEVSVNTLNKFSGEHWCHSETLDL